MSTTNLIHFAQNLWGIFPPTLIRRSENSFRRTIGPGAAKAILQGYTEKNSPWQRSEVTVQLRPQTCSDGRCGWIESWGIFWKECGNARLELRAWDVAGSVSSHQRTEGFQPMALGIWQIVFFLHLFSSGSGDGSQDLELARQMFND